MTMKDIHQGFARQGLIRPSEGRVLGGVVAGLGRRLGIAPWPARILFALVLLLIPGSQILIYPILWILMRQSPASPPRRGAPPPLQPDRWFRARIIALEPEPR